MLEDIVTRRRAVGFLFAVPVMLAAGPFLCEAASAQEVNDDAALMKRFGGPATAN